MWVIFPKIVMESSGDIWGSGGFANGNKFCSVIWEVSVIRNDSAILWNMPQVARPFVHTYFCIPWRLATRAIQDSIGWIRVAKTMGVWTFFSNSHPLHFAVYNNFFFSSSDDQKLIQNTSKSNVTVSFHLTFLTKHENLTKEQTI